MSNPLTEPWYGVRCVFQHGPSVGNPELTSYEERVVLLKADSLEQALVKAEREARQYAADVNATYTGLAQAFHIAEDEITELSEVFSLVRDSRLAPEEYLNRHFDTGAEREIRAE